MTFAEIIQLLGLVVSLLDKLQGLGINMQGVHINDIMKLFGQAPITVVSQPGQPAILPDGTAVPLQHS